MSDLELAAKHKYKLPSGEIAINVTAISGLLDDGKAAGFAGAAVKLTKEGQNYREVWKKSGEDGTRRHGYCEAFLKDQPIDCLPEDMGYVDAIEKFIIDHDPQVIELEGIALSTRGYGGRFDILVVIEGEVWLIDLKTGKRYAVEHTLQLSAYRFADGIGEYDTDGNLLGLAPLPHIDHAAALYVAEDGSYDLVEYPADERAFGVFLGLLDAYQWTRSDQIKLTVKESRA
jgi:hypothetical protein